MRKTICIVLILICMLNINVFAGKPLFTIDGTNGKCGDEIIVGIQMSDITDISSFTIDINYSKDYLSPLEVEKTDLLDGQLVFNSNYQDNVLRIVYASEKNIGSAGEILKIKFKVNEYQKGDVDLEFSGNVVFLGNEKLEIVEGDIIGAKVHIEKNENYIENEEKKISISEVECNYGEQATISVFTDEILEACSGSMTVYYDPGIEIVKCEEGDVFTESNVMINPISDKNEIKMNFVGVTPIAQKGSILNILISVKSNETKEYNVGIKDISMFKMDESYIPVSVKNGRISCAEQKTHNPSRGISGGSSISTINTTQKSYGTSEEKSTGQENEKVQFIFKDIQPVDWFYDAVIFAFENGITSGVSETEFAPNDNVTRGQFITMLCRAYKVPEMTGDNFSDCGNTWYTGYLAAAKQLGISNGVGDNMFAPEKEITREEMVTLIYNYLKSIGETEGEFSDTQFADDYLISDWAKAGVAFASEKNYVNGKGNNTFDPKGRATRAELAQIFYNIFK